MAGLLALGSLLAERSEFHATLHAVGFTHPTDLLPAPDLIRGLCRIGFGTQRRAVPVLYSQHKAAGRYRAANFAFSASFTGGVTNLPTSPFSRAISFTSFEAIAW